MNIDRNVLCFLEQHFSLISYLFEVVHQIDKYFPNAPIELSVLDAFDGMDERLNIEIIVIIPPEEAHEILNKFRDNWYLTHYEHLIAIGLKWR